MNEKLKSFFIIGTGVLRALIILILAVFIYNSMEIFARGFSLVMNIVSDMLLSGSNIEICVAFFICAWLWIQVIKIAIWFYNLSTEFIYDMVEKE